MNVSPRRQTGSSSTTLTNSNPSLLHQTRSRSPSRSISPIYRSRSPETFLPPPVQFPQHTTISSNSSSSSSSPSLTHGLPQKQMQEINRFNQLNEHQHQQQQQEEQQQQLNLINTAVTEVVNDISNDGEQNNRGRTRIRQKKQIHQQSMHSLNSKTISLMGFNIPTK